VFDDSPTAEDGLRAVHRFLVSLDAEALPAGFGSSLRVAAQLVLIAVREGELAASAQRLVEQELAALGASTEAELCAGLRTRRWTHQDTQLLDALDRITAIRLAVDDPGRAKVEHVVLMGDAR
jgi:hypothetical protein